MSATGGEGARDQRDGGPSGVPATGKLLARALAGDAAAESAVFGRHRDRLVVEARAHPLMRFLKRTTTPEDVVDEVFVRALGSGILKRFEDRGPGSLRRMLGRILERTLLDACRRCGAAKRAAEQRAASVDSLGDGETHGASPVSHWTTPTGRARVRELVERCRALLTEREFEAWQLVEIDELDSGAAARRLGTTASAVRGVVARARAKLTEALRSDS